MRLGRYEVMAPDMARTLWPQPNARAVVQPQPASGALFLRDSQALPAPDAAHPVRANVPACISKQGRDPAVAVTAILRSKRNDGAGEAIFVSTNSGDVSLRSPRLADDAAGPAFRETISFPDTVDRLPPPVGR